MRRLIVLLAGLVVLVGLVAVTHSPAATQLSQLEKSALAEIPIPPPEPRFTRTTYAATNLDGATALLDTCKGPIAVYLGAQRPFEARNGHEKNVEFGADHHPRSIAGTRERIDIFLENG